ncbi:hypothetical protein C8R47DRAFT_1178958 [Mycena vitilis]|nr:hypothetical protein C8R47DRAFT_1178958 [Mycena vitilis]
MHPWITMKLNDIKRVFHPHSHRPEIEMGFHDYRISQVRPERRPPTDNEPWAPFRTRLDFEVAEFSQDAMLNKTQISTLISLIRRCAENIEGFTIRSQSDLEKQWNLASQKCTEFERFEVAVPYKGIDRVFEMYARPLWSWTLDLIQDPHLASFFVWDAERDYIWNGTKYIRFYTEPWTADAMWEIQSKLVNSPDHKLCPYIIYADKAKLSSFGTQKGYPVVARLANLVVSLRNSSDWGGGQIVGWLPVVEEDQAETGKPPYVNFKNAVWHQAFYKLLESIVPASRTGVWTTCGDGLDRCLYPIILILASDYEEACVMALIRGLRANFPCPICYIKKEDQADFSKTAELRTAHGSQNVITKARKLKAEPREELLKKHGLRNVDNVFWKVAYSDPHHALSFEHLHAYSSGLFGNHTFEQFKKHVEMVPGRAKADIDEQFAAFPRWRNLSHFESVMGISFNDGSKYEDISKMIILVSHHILVRKIDVLLLQICRCYQEMSLWITMKLQTEERIAEGRQVYSKFGCLLKSDPTDQKNWNFPKIHSHKHVFEDLERKGAARNFGAKIDEAMHRTTRTAYLRQTNFKNVAPQILKSEHRTMVAKYIRDQINDIDITQRPPDGSSQSGDETETETPRDLGTQSDNIALGAKQPPICFDKLEEEMAAKDPAFQRFRIKLGKFLTEFLPTYGFQLPQGKPVSFHSSDLILPYNFLKVFYQSLDDWADEADFLRCNPNFHGRPRFDGALVLTPKGEIFVRLIYMFEVSLDGKTYPFALVQPFDAPVGRISAKDKALKLFRVRAKRRQESEFIPVRSIIRGAVLVPDPQHAGDCLVMDNVGGDMFLRLKDLYRDRFE